MDPHHLCMRIKQDGQSMFANSRDMSVHEIEQNQDLRMQSNENTHLRDRSGLSSYVRENGGRCLREAAVLHVDLFLQEIVTVLPYVVRRVAANLALIAEHQLRVGGVCANEQTGGSACVQMQQSRTSHDGASWRFLRYRETRGSAGV